ncbi:effector binding domain-containing protein [candidate division KSB1 bacterium]|nr:effector binding domain-containing protein [candidate division KSB1 bacterium]
MHTETSKRDTMHFIGMTVRTTNKAEANGTAKIGGLWQRFVQDDVFNHIPHKVSPAIYAVYHDYASDINGEYMVLIGCEVSRIDSVPDGMDAATLPAAHYTVFTTEQGPVQQVVPDTWRDIWINWMPDHGHRRTYTGDFEEYGDEAMDPNNARVKIFIAVDSHGRV